MLCKFSIQQWALPLLRSYYLSPLRPYCVTFRWVFLFCFFDHWSEISAIDTPIKREKRFLSWMATKSTFSLKAKFFFSILRNIYTSTVACCVHLFFNNNNNQNNNERNIYFLFFNIPFNKLPPKLLCSFASKALKSHNLCISEFLFVSFWSGLSKKLCELHFENWLFGAHITHTASIRVLHHLWRKRRILHKFGNVALPCQTQWLKSDLNSSAILFNGKVWQVFHSNDNEFSGPSLCTLHGKTSEAVENPIHLPPAVLFIESEMVNNDLQPSPSICLSRTNFG